MNLRIVIFTLCYTLLVSSCLKDSPCYFDATLTVRTASQSKGVGEVVAYIFDDKGLFVETITTYMPTFASEVNISLSHLPNAKYQCVVWANCESSVCVPKMTTSSQLNDLSVSILETENALAQFPNDIFYGNISFERNSRKRSWEVVNISRIVGGVIVKLLGIDNLRHNYSVSLKGTLGSIPYLNELTSGDIIRANSFLPLYLFDLNESNHYQAGPHFLFPSGSNQTLSINLFDNGHLVRSIDLNTKIKVDKVTSITLSASGDDHIIEELSWDAVIQEEN